MKKGRKEKLEIILLIMTVILGAVLLICNFFKITPGVDNIVAEIITEAIAYGILSGPIFLLGGLYAIYEIMNPDKFLDEGTH